MRTFGLFLIMVFTVSISFAFAEEDLVFVDTDKKYYSQGDIILISGNVNKNLFGTDVNLVLVDPSGDIILIDKLNVKNKHYGTQVKVDPDLFSSSGTYTVYARYGSDQSISPISVNFKQPDRFLSTNESQTRVLLNFDFIKPSKNEIQEHVDYKIKILKNGFEVYGPTHITHSSSGSVSLPLMLNERQPYDVVIEVSGILFQQSSPQDASFSIMTGSKTIQSEFTSKNALRINLALNRDPSPEPSIVPDWIKNNAKWWAHGEIDDRTFTQSVEYLIQNKIVDIPDLPYPASWMDKDVPSWVKNNASWWADDLIKEDDFIKGIKFLVEKGVIQINII